MATPSMTRRSRKYFKKIQRADSKYGLQEIASAIQTDLDKRHLSYDEALMLGNMIQNRADQVPGDGIVYAISDRDAYRRTLELNGFDEDQDHLAVQADCLQWLEDGPVDEESYDIVICDPPTFSNSKRMKVDSFSIDRDHAQLLGWLAAFVAPKGELFFSTNSRSFRMDDAAVPAGFGCHEISRRSVPEDFRNRKIHRCWRFAERWKHKGQ